MKDRSSYIRRTVVGFEFEEIPRELIGKEFIIDDYQKATDEFYVIHNLVYELFLPADIVIKQITDPIQQAIQLLTDNGYKITKKIK